MRKGKRAKRPVNPSSNKKWLEKKSTSVNAVSGGKGR